MSIEHISRPLADVVLRALVATDKRTAQCELCGASSDLMGFAPVCTACADRWGGRLHAKLWIADWWTYERWRDGLREGK